MKPCLPLRLKPLWVLVLPLLLSACTPDYGDSEWFTFSGYKSKGYTPYLSVRFKTPSKAWHCTDAFFSMLDGEMGRASKSAELEYRATASEDGLHYEVKFPDSYFQGGCEYRAEGVAIMLEENNTLNPQWMKDSMWMRKTKIRSGGAIGFLVGKAAESQPLSDDTSPINPSYVLCRPWNWRALWLDADVVRDAQGNPEKWYKEMACQRQGFHERVHVPVNLTPAYIRTIQGRFTVNILVEEEIYCSECSLEELQETGWASFDDNRTPIAHRAVFEAFEQANGLKGAQ